jgi:hypothetical protein
MCHWHFIGTLKPERSGLPLRSDSGNREPATFGLDPNTQSEKAGAIRLTVLWISKVILLAWFHERCVHIVGGDDAHLAKVLPSTP